jgi:hypothetical protein
MIGATGSDQVAPQNGKGEAQKPLSQKRGGGATHPSITLHDMGIEEFTSRVSGDGS